VTIRRGFDFALDLFTSCLWALAAFFVGARLLSSNAGLLLALAVFVTAMTFILTSRAQERGAQAIAAGACPRCGAALATDHEHRRWDTSNRKWLAPLTTWRCATCGFQQEASLGCEACPESD
jgi:hypothetical protein